MIEPDFLSLIAQGADAWNQWRYHHPHCVPNLSNAYLFESVLDRFNLKDVNFERACLIGASFQFANLQRANLYSAYASSAVFKCANLTAANLTDGVFSEADFTQANLHEAIALGSNFSEAVFHRARMLNWQVDETTLLEDRKGAMQTMVPARRFVTHLVSAPALTRSVTIFQAVPVAC